MDESMSNFESFDIRRTLRKHACSKKRLSQILKRWNGGTKHVKRWISVCEYHRTYMYLESLHSFSVFLWGIKYSFFDYLTLILLCTK